nr:putative reverse transcriptase domain-containing protein [Tanacetum cinerariifolium]
MRKPMEFQVGDKVMLKVSPWKGVVRFGKRGKLYPRYVGLFKVLERIGDVAYKLDLPEEPGKVHNTFHVSNLKKCHADEPLAVPLDGLHVDDKLHFVEKPVEIVDRFISGGIIGRFKHEAFGKFKEWKKLVENQIGGLVKKLRTDNGLEFCNKEFKQLCIESGIARHLTVDETSQQNGLAKRMNRTLMDK